MIKPASYLIGKLAEKMRPPFDYRDFISFLELNKALKRVRNQMPGATLEDYLFEVSANDAILDDLIKEYVRQQDLEIVVTYPSKRLPAGWLTTRETIKKWFRSVIAGTEIIIVMPILQPDQISDFFVEIHAAGKRGAVVTVLTLPPRSVFSDKKEEQELSISMLRDAGIKVHHMKDLWFHAKIICFGEHATYIGSANWTEGGFKKNLEMGVIIRGERSKSVFSFFKSFIDN
ncbi:MAG: phospholipase D family protein [Candidatus Micrarchaeia archaeon]